MDRQHAAVAPREIHVVKLIDRLDNLLEMDTSQDFCDVYCHESELLLGVLRNSDPTLADEAQERIDWIREIRKMQEWK